MTNFTVTKCWIGGLLACAISGTGCGGRDAGEAGDETSGTATGDDGSSGTNDDGASGGPENDTGEDDTGDDGGEPGGPLVEVVACRYAASPELVEGEHYECGDLIVPEDRARAGSPDIRVHFIRFFAENEQPNATIYLDGGPGGSGAGVAGIPAGGIAALTLAGDFLVVSQRGTRFSEPALMCDANPNQPGTGEALAKCADDFQAAGIDVRAYNTQANADDIDDLRGALGYERSTLFGISYGSRLALEVMRRHPDRVRASIIDGVVPAGTNWIARSSIAFWGAVNGLADACTDDPVCSQAFGSFDDALVEMAQTLDAEPLEIDLGGQSFVLDGNTATFVVFGAMYNTIFYPALPLLVTSLRDRNIDAIDSLLPFFLLSGDDPDVAGGMYMSMVCDELFNPSFGDDIETLLAQSDVPEPLATYARMRFESVSDACAAWPRRSADPVINQPVQSSVRTLVSSGEFDPITPPGYGELAAQTLSNAEVVVFGRSGHGTIVESECSQGILISFLIDPEAAPSTACTMAIGIDFITTQEEFFQGLGAAPVVTPLQLGL